MRKATYKCLALPILHSSGPHKIPATTHLWPGHSSEAPDGYWCPADYPLSSGEARLYLDYFSNADAGELERMRHISLTSLNVSEAGQLEELAALREFAGELPRPELPVLFSHAQKILLLRWWQEELELQIFHLEKECLKADQDLLACVRETDESARQIPDIMLPGLPWKTCVSNALPFIPCEMPILVGGEMGEDLAERFHFDESTAMEHGFAGCSAAWLSAYEILGRSRRWPDNIWRQSRLWLLE